MSFTGAVQQWFLAKNGRTGGTSAQCLAHSGLERGVNRTELILREGTPMRIVYFLILVIVVAAVVVFAVQNNVPVTLQYLDQSVSTTLPLLVVVVYLLGMLSGWTVVGFLRPLPPASDGAWERLSGAS